MDRRTRRVSRHVDALLNDRRPPAGSPDPDDLGALVVAIDMVSARPQAGLPHPRFVSGWRRASVSRHRESSAAAAS